MLQFNKLRLTGFKSFVDNTELHINLGLTGVVGPNGCGKSNLVEALRWVMGETSAKQMRGSGMEDVIFGGTASRPQRLSAEVVLALDNSKRTAPAIFNDNEEVEVSRKIERDKGSTYRVNGKEVRARDVQLLFADSSTGARSTALVSQGRIGAVINAKPEQRRALLEEAAGITGLHSRRHEAELRLNGAKTNLERLDDILITLETQLGNLKKQSRQANRYTNLNDHILKAEATMFHVRWKQAEEMLQAAEERLHTAQAQVVKLTAVASQAATDQANKSETLPELHQAEASAAADLHRITVARDNLVIEEKRLQNTLTTTRQRLEQISMDETRAKAFAADAKESTERLISEKLEIESAREEELEERNAAVKALTEADAEANTAENALNSANALLANIEAQRNSCTQRISEMEERLKQMASRARELEGQINKHKENQPKNSDIEVAELTLTECTTAVSVAQKALENAELTRAETEAQLRAATTEFQNANATLTRLRAEEQAICNFLNDSEGDLWQALIDTVSVKSGYAVALGVALGEDLNAPSDETAPIHWRTLNPLTSSSALPAGAIPMSDLVNAPSALTRRLQQIGVVDTDEQGEILARDLDQGQRLVSREGGLWRWDGYTVTSQAITPASARLEQRNRLVEVRDLLNTAMNAVSTAELVRETAETAERSARVAEHTTRDELRKADQALNAARESLASEKEKTTAYKTHFDALKEALETVKVDQEKNQESLGTLQVEMANLPNLLREKETAAKLRNKLAEIRAYQVNCRSRHDLLERVAEERSNRLQTIAKELNTWERRNQDSIQQLEDLTKRKETLHNELKGLEGKPANLKIQHQNLMNSIKVSDAKRSDAADALADAQTKLRKADQTLREAEMKLAQAREHRVRNESELDHAGQVCTDLKERISERISCSPEKLYEIANLDLNKPLPELEACERKVERLLRERETMGPVNLLAQKEAEELTIQIDTLNSERDDLLKAIDKLRHGISELNREGRTRLLESFAEVDKHFQGLFMRLFGGGRAHLALTGSDDPLEAGLEIMASPPGKKLQVLSLLSGGEQALTAIALLFGVFLTNPAPICVLDEVDAPLDDSNVDRFCTMLEEMAKKEKTRFLIITHHRMTMARMDRLFGVTMQERGVSQLVSVDLEEAEKLRDIA